MKPFDFPLIADENIHPDVIFHLKQKNIKIFSIYESELRGKSDDEIIKFAKDAGKVILTHDSDFGRLSIFEKNFLLE